MRLAVGSVIAERYRLSSLIGRGGIGEVWSAVHLVTGRRVSIKRLLRTDQDRTEEARARFVREARAASAVDHPNVVEVLDFLQSDDEEPLLVMELLSGETLADLLRRTPRLGIEQTSRLLLPVVSAVGTAHALGIVHRDLKPANIYLHARTSGPLVKVLDFGMAKWVAWYASPSDPRTRAGFTLGTPRYMAPEQACGGTITHRVDVWALGVVLYECLTGVRPIEGEEPADVLMSLKNKGIVPVEKLVPTLPIELSELIGRMLSRDPAERTQDLRDAFTVLSSYTTTTAPTFGPPDVDFVTAAELPASMRPRPTVASAPAPRQRDARAHRWRRNVTVLAVAAALLGLLALVFSARLRRSIPADSHVHSR